MPLPICPPNAVYPPVASPPTPPPGPLSEPLPAAPLPLPLPPSLLLSPGLSILTLPKLPLVIP